MRGTADSGGRPRLMARAAGCVHLKQQQLVRTGRVRRRPAGVGGGRPGAWGGLGAWSAGRGRGHRRGRAGQAGGPRRRRGRRQAGGVPWACSETGCQSRQVASRDS
jgi:hypothetical protein